MQDQDPKSHLRDSHSSIPPGHNGQYDGANYDSLSPPPAPDEQYYVAPTLPDALAPPVPRRTTEEIHDEPATQQTSSPGIPSTPPISSSSPEYGFPPPATGEPRPWFEQTLSSYDYSSPYPVSAPQQGGFFAQKSRRFWLTLGGIALLIVGLPVLLFQEYSYLNRSTPMKTLDTFCNALVQENYPQAYEQFAPNLQLRIPRSRFIVLLAQDRVISCTHGNADENSKLVRAKLKLVHNSQGINNDVVVLKKGEDNQWKIADVKQAR